MQAAGHPNLTLLVDPLHLIRTGGTPPEIGATVTLHAPAHGLHLIDETAA